MYKEVAPNSVTNEKLREKTAREIESWLVANVARQLQCENAQVDPHRPLAEHGLDSATAIGISGDLEEWLGRAVEPTLVYDHPTIAEIAAFLAKGSAAALSPAKNGAASQPAPSAPAGHVAHEPIAIVGIGCRFPGADGPAAFWKLLCGGVDAISEVPPERWDRTQFDDADPAVLLATNTRWGGFLKNVDQFDPDYFNISPREAAYIDPQQRLLLEVAHEALDDAGLPGERLAGSPTGVFIGISTNDYAQLPLADLPTLDPYWSIGNALSIAANRLSYVLDLHGPSLAVDTACSSSLVAIHMACRSLQLGESTVALAGGVNLMLSPAIAISFSRGGALSPDGRCKAFDARANGIVRGEGVGVVVLKRLSQAIADGDRVYAAIRGSAVNQDGRTNGLAAPNQSAQEAVLRAAYADAQVAPADVQYIEAHGTGTLLGDPIEMKALGSVLGEGRRQTAGNRRAHKPCCMVGSVKTNIGHLEAAAGVAGLIKTALAIHHAQLPPTVHFRQPNPHIPFDALPLGVQSQLTDWQAPSGRLLSGVSAFGFGGTNAHVVLESVQPVAKCGNAALESGHAAPLPFILPLSARSQPALAQMASQLAARLGGMPREASDQQLLANLCYTAGVHRTQHDRRAGVVFTDRQSLQEKLAALASTNSAASTAASKRTPIVFVYSGHEAQWWGMGRTLLAEQPVYRQVIEECDRLLRPIASWSLLAEMEADEARSRITAREVEISQTALFALQVGLTALWKSWGVVPDAVVGHSVGEVAAAHVAGALSLQDALLVVFHRSRLMQRGIEQTSGQGSMAAVRLSMGAAQQALVGWEDRLSVAVSNSPDYTILSGDTAALGELLAQLKQQRVASRSLSAPGAGHSPQVEPLREELVHALRNIAPRDAVIPILSTVTLTWPEGRQFDAAYWGRNLREPVRFAGAVGELISRGMTAFLEIGPHPILATAITQCGRDRSVEPIVRASLKRRADDRQTLGESLAAMFECGAPIAWSSLYPQAERVELPTYPWQRQRCWFEGPPPWSAESGRLGAVRNAWATKASSSQWLDRRIEVATQPGMLCWESDLNPARLAGLLMSGDAAVQTFAPAVLLELVRSALAEVNPTGTIDLTNLQFSESVDLAGHGVTTLQIVLQRLGGDEYEFQVFSRDAVTPAEATGSVASRWTRRASGRAQQHIVASTHSYANGSSSVANGADSSKNGTADARRNVIARPATSMREQLRVATDDAARQAIIQSLLCQELGRVVKIDPAKIDPHALLTNYNIDSLMVVELKNSLEDALETLISPTAVFQYPTIAALSAYLASTLDAPAELPRPLAVAAGDGPSSLPAWAESLVRDPVVLAAQLDNLSDMEVDSLLNALVSERVVTDDDLHAWMAESTR